MDWLTTVTTTTGLTVTPVHPSLLLPVTRVNSMTTETTMPRETNMTMLYIAFIAGTLLIFTITLFPVSNLAAKYAPSPNLTRQRK